MHDTSTPPLNLSEPLWRRSLPSVAIQIGRTPLYPIRRLHGREGVRVYAKLEWHQLSGSVKARAAFQIIHQALEQGLLHPGKTLLDATSGNTGIAYAAIGRALGLKVALCLPENASPARKNILQTLGAEVIYTSRFEGTDGAQSVARAMAEAHPERYFYADQYRNDANWQAHYHGTSVEILSALPEVTHFVAGLGTTGTFTGVGRRLKAERTSIRLTALQPDTPMHGLEGWKHLETAITPPIYDAGLADEMLEIGSEEAYAMIRDAYRYEGLRLSPSSAANLVGALRVAAQLEQGVVVTLFPDNADKYEELDSLLL